MSNFLYKYGGYTHEVGEIQDFKWSHTPHVTGKSQRDIAIYRITLRGKLLNCTTDTWQEIRDKIHAVKDAYSWGNDQKFSVVNPDGTDSGYVLDPASDPDILKGPYLVNFEYPTGSIEELVAKREYTIVMEAIRAEVEDEIIEYSETITHVGNCMASWAFQNTINRKDSSGNLLVGTPRSYSIWPATTQKIIQKGHSVGFDGYYCPGWNAGFQTMGIPALNTTTFEHQERRIEIPGKPLHLGRGFVYYPADWVYTYESAQPQFVIPA